MMHAGLHVLEQGNGRVDNEFCKNHMRSVPLTAEPTLFRVMLVVVMKRSCHGATSACSALPQASCKCSAKCGVVLGMRLTTVSKLHDGKHITCAVLHTVQSSCLQLAISDFCPPRT